MPSDAHRIRLESDDFACDDVQVHRVRGREEISRLFSFRVDVVTSGAPLSSTELVGASVVLCFERGGDTTRRLHAVIAAVDEDLDMEQDDRFGASWHIVPRAHWLTMVHTQDVFQHLSVPAIVREKLQRVDLAPGTTMRLEGNYPERDFVVQYRETDLAFISRLCEHLGISFFFEEDADTTKIVFTDHNGGFARRDDQYEIPYRGRGERRDVFALRRTTELRPAHFVVMDYNYRAPRVDLTASAAAEHGFAGGFVEYGTHHRDAEAGRELARVRAEESDAQHRVYQGESTLAEIAAGHRYRLVGHPRVDAPELLVTSVEHEAEQGLFSQASGEGFYRNRFTAIDAAQTFRPPRRTPKPRISGWMHGVVQPRPREELGDFAQLDAYGRYVVKFLFHVAESPELQASKPVRMAQPHVGPDHGMHFPLRPGVEVALAFMEGDPDRPIIVGAIHNARTPDHVTNANPKLNRIRTGTGVQITIQDAR